MNSASLAGRYDHLIPPRFLAPIDSLKIPALAFCHAYFCQDDDLVHGLTGCSPKLNLAFYSDRVSGNSSTPFIRPETDVSWNSAVSDAVLLKRCSAVLLKRCSAVLLNAVPLKRCLAEMLFRLKGQCHEIFDLWFFYESVSPKPLSIQ
jgi:hypothetical protein